MKKRDAYDVEVGKRLELLCKALNMSQRALSQVVGMTEQQWHNAKVGDNLFPVPNAAAR
jgi:transcriptional regulator with XRE-family HTH domain